MNTEILKQYAIRILNEIGILADEESIERQFVSNQIETKEYDVLGVKIKAVVTNFGSLCRVEVNFRLPENGVLAQTYMDHCAGIEKIHQNHSYKYSYGPRYQSYADELRGKNTEAFSPWNNRYFTVWSEGYKTTEIKEAVTNCIALAKLFVSHLKDLSSLRYWNSTDEEIVARAKEIIENAAFQETDCDRETKGHYLEDKNSFFKGWFYPFNDKGNGTFDILWPSSVENAASGIEGSFEYAVSCLLLINKDYIAKARKACRIRKRTVTVIY